MVELEAVVMVDIDCNDEVVFGVYGAYLFYFFIMA